VAKALSSNQYHTAVPGRRKDNYLFKILIFSDYWQLNIKKEDPLFCPDQMQSSTPEVVYSYLEPTLSSHFGTRSSYQKLGHAKKLLPRTRKVKKVS
jgi:hypothetical protein